VTLLAVRYLLPAAILAAGVVLLTMEGDSANGAGAALTLVAVCVFLFNIYLRIGFRDEADRRREEEAREYYDRHGRWPDEED
jgi:drug/metabolite transporter (DMT)-like permease